MDKWSDLVKSITKTIGVAGVEELEKIIARLGSSASKPWQRALLNMAGDLISKHGIDGINMLGNIVDDILMGDEPDLSFASLRDRSDYLAAIQNIEADDKKKVKDFFNQLGNDLGVIIKAIISGILGQV
jgi:hypothetical protein